MPNDYYFSAAYTVLQFVILATAWNILGGYAGYVNFGSAGVLRRSAPTPRSSLYKAVEAAAPRDDPSRAPLVAGLARPRHWAI